MNFEEYLYIVVPYSFTMFIFILYYAKSLEVFKYSYTIGFMGSIWSGYNFIAFPLIGFFYFREWFNKDIYIISLMFLIMIIYFINMFIGFYISNKTVIWNRLFSWLMLENKTKELSSSLSLKILFILYFFLVLYTFYNNYTMYGTINSFTILSTQGLVTDGQIVAIQKGIKIYIDAISGDLIRLSFIMLIGMLLYNKKTKISFMLLLFHIFLMLSAKSKYVMVYPLFYIALYSFYVKPIKLKYVLSFVFLLAFIGIYSINVIRSGGDLSNFDLSRLDYIIKVVIWRGDFFHGLYFLLDEMINKGMLASGGVTIFSLVFRIIPRSVWPDRYGSTDIELTRELFGFAHEKGWAMNFGGIGEFIYSFHLPGVILIGVLAGIVIYTINKILIRSMKNGNFLLVSFILANPIWFMPWNIGINDYFGRKFIFAFLGFYLLIWILTTLNRIRISKNV
jgi:hypothetical protein